MLVVVVVTRMSLDLHQETVDLLRLMGAGDAYVGRQFEQHALSNALRGGLLGFTAAVADPGALRRRAGDRPLAAGCRGWSWRPATGCCSAACRWRQRC